MGGVVDRVLVKDGDVVQAGQVLLRLDDTVGGTAAESAGTIDNRLAARRARLKAEASGAAQIPSPERNGDADSRQAFDAEARLLSLRRAALVEEMNQISAETAQVDAQIAGLEAQLSSLRAQSELAKGEREGVESLWTRRLVTINRLNQARRLTVELDGRIAVAQAGIREARMRQSALSLRKAELLHSRRASASAELAELELDLARQAPQSATVSERMVRRDIRAPIAGMVNRLTVRGPGQVVKPAEPLLEIAPRRGELIVEARISPADIELLSLGQIAVVRFPSLDRALTPELTGEVKFISASETPVAANRPAGFFLVRVHLRGNAIAGDSPTLKVGMPAEVFIRTRSRTLMSYLFKPLFNQFTRALRSD